MIYGAFPDPRPASWFDPPDEWANAVCHVCEDEPIDEDSAYMEGDDVFVCESCAEKFCSTHGVQTCEECEDASRQGLL